MIEWFEVENFKSIKKLRLGFSPLMVFVGPNGAGKTNIVQSLSLLLDIIAEGSTEPTELYGGYEQLILRRKQPARSGLRFAIRAPLNSRYLSTVSEKGKLPIIMQLDITLKPLADSELVQVWREEFSLEQAGEILISYLFADDSLQDFKVSDNEDTNNIIGYSLAKSNKIEIEKRFKYIDDSRLKCSTFLLYRLARSLPGVVRLRLDSSALRNDSALGVLRHGRPLGLSGDGLPLAVERMRKKRNLSQQIDFRRVLKKLQDVYPRIEDVSTVHYQPGRVALSFKERKIDGRLGEANVSDGVIHALALLVALEQTSSTDVLIIEEPENALHPWALQKIISDAQAERPRLEPLILTTHSPILVSTIKSTQSLFIVENDEKKGTIVTPALEKERALEAILAESGQKLGEIWLDGTLGGVPGVDH